MNCEWVPRMTRMKALINPRNGSVQGRNLSEDNRFSIKLRTTGDRIMPVGVNGIWKVFPRRKPLQ